MITKGDGQTFPLTFTSIANLELPVNLTCMSLDGGKKPEHLEGPGQHTERPVSAIGIGPSSF